MGNSRRSRRMHSRRITDAQRGAIEEAYLNAQQRMHSNVLPQHPTYPPSQHLHMSPEDTTRCQQAIALAQAGKRRQAHVQFCFLHDHGNAENVTLLFWLARTTPFLEEARRMLATIERLEPTHPDIPGLRTFVRKWERKGAPAGMDHAPGLPPVIGIILGVTLVVAILVTARSVPSPSPVTPTEVPYYYSTQTDTTNPGLTYPTPATGNGFIVGCRDGSTSHAGGKRGACSHHGGESR